jgi:DeoR/GlpR family transcriptional regulator of sugar metabolism
MKKAERWNTILQRLANEGGLSVSTLANDLGVSDSTIRRDLSGLHASNLLHRVHGGAMTSGVLNELSIGAKSRQRRHDGHGTRQGALEPQPHRRHQRAQHRRDAHHVSEH